MIAPIKNQPATTSVAPSSDQAIVPSSQSSDQATVPSFESLLDGGMRQQFQKACQGMSHDKREEVIQELTCIAWSMYQSLVDRNKTESIFSTPLADFSIRHYFSGRRFTGMSAVDVSAARCQILGRSSVANTMNNYYICRKTFRPSTIGCFNIDFEAWVNTLDDRMRSILSLILEGHTTGELAKRFGVSPGRVTQLRHELIASWKSFTADRPTEEEGE